MGRVVAVGCPHHFTERGNFRRYVFLHEEDRETYLALLARYASLAELEILGYCLMTNHAHLIVVPRRCDSMATAFRRVHGSYPQRLNIRLREAARTGRPFGTDDFAAELEAKLDRTLFPQEPGPKTKEESQAARSGATMEIGS